jgi:hypothetical protein
VINQEGVKWGWLLIEHGLELLEQGDVYWASENIKAGLRVIQESTPLLKKKAVAGNNSDTVKRTCGRSCSCRTANWCMSCHMYSHHCECIAGRVVNPPTKKAAK